MRGSERTIHCPDGYAIHLVLKSQVVIGTCPDISDEPVIVQNVVAGREQHIRCNGCTQVFGCVGRDAMTVDEKAEIYGSDPTSTGIHEIAQQAFESFYLDMDETQEAVIPLVTTLL